MDMKKKIKENWYFIFLPIIMVAIYFFTYKTNQLIQVISYEALIIFGFVAAVSDMKKKLVSNKLIIYLLLTWVAIMSCWLIVDIDQALFNGFYSIVGFLVVGLVFLFMYFVSRGGLGGADVKFMAVVALYMGVSNTLTATLIGSVLASLYALILIITKKMKKSDTIPLIPFLYVGIILILILI